MNIIIGLHGVQLLIRNMIVVLSVLGETISFEYDDWLVIYSLCVNTILSCICLLESMQENTKGHDSYLV